MVFLTIITSFVIMYAAKCLKTNEALRRFRGNTGMRAFISGEQAGRLCAQKFLGWPGKITCSP